MKNLLLLIPLLALLTACSDSDDNTPAQDYIKAPFLPSNELYWGMSVAEATRKIEEGGEWVLYYFNKELDLDFCKPGEESLPHWDRNEWNAGFYDSEKLAALHFTCRKNVDFYKEYLSKVFKHDYSDTLYHHIDNYYVQIIAIEDYILYLSYGTRDPFL